MKWNASKNTAQGNRAGRGAVIEGKSASLAGEFGMKMLRAKFPELADEMLAKLGTFTRGPRKGLQRGYIHWEKIIEGGFDYRIDRRRVVRPGTQDWAVLDSADARNGKDVGALIMAERAAAEKAKYDALPESVKLAHRALAVRKTAHIERLEAIARGNSLENSDFPYLIRKARRLMRQARGYHFPGL